MEIANNNQLARISENSPSRRSVNDGDSDEKSTEDSSGFEGTLVASMMPGAQKTPAQQPGIVQSGGAQGGQEGVVPMTEGAKAAANPGESIANAVRTNGQATKGVQFPDVKRLLDTKSSQSVNGTMTDAFVAGPNTPWKSDWVFGEGKPVAGSNAEKLQGIAQALAQLQNAAEQNANGMGGDESQLSQIQSAMAGLDGELTKVEADVAKASKPQLLSGAEYLNALQGAQSLTGQGEMGGQGAGQQFGSDASGRFAAQQMAAAAKGANANREGLQLIPGGVSSGKDRLASIEKSDDAKRAPEWTLGVAPQNLVQTNSKMEPLVVTGNVVPGSMMKDRLTSDSLINVSSGISKLNASGGGEMRIRLNPENLGQLTIHVATNGQGDVGLKVQASSGGAKKILEESMNSLREGLASQNLMLGRVDVSVLSSNTGSDLNGQGSQQHGWNNPQQGSMDLSQNSMQGREGSSRWDRDTGASPEARIARANVSSAAFGPSRSRAAGASSSRLDVMA